jgi:hypothetical protein
MLFFCSADALDFQTTFKGIVDNREARSSLWKPQTIFGGLATTRVGWNIDTVHRFRAGISLFREYGSDKVMDQVEALWYYQYNKEPHRFVIGVAPRQDLAHYPDFLISDSYCYYHPNIQGAFYEFRKPTFSEHIWIDWTSRRTVEHREAFLLGIAGTVSHGTFRFSHYFLYYHLALSDGPPPKEHVTDNGGIVLRAQKTFSGIGFPDSISIGIDGLVSLDRERSVTSWHTPAGMQLFSDIRIKRFGVGITYFQELYPDGGRHHNLSFGESNYRGEAWGALTLAFLPIVSQYVNARFTLHLYLEEKKIDNRETFILDFSFGRLWKNHRRESTTAQTPGAI